MPVGTRSRSIPGLWLMLVSSMACNEPQPAPASNAEVAARPTPTPTAQLDPTGFPEGPGFGDVIANCTGCHSARLVHQNRATKQGWLDMIRWMQTHHKLWELAPDVEDRITTYLATHFGPVQDETGMRRVPIAAHLMPPTEAELALGEGRR